MNRTLLNFEGEIRAHAAKRHGIVSEGILLWNCIHQLVANYRDQHPDWLFVRHEDISLDPVPRFRAIFVALGLPFTKEAEAAILDSSGAHNPTEQTRHKEHLRDSKKNIRNWEKRLSDSEITQIRLGTHELFSQFYTECDW